MQWVILHRIRTILIFYALVVSWESLDPAWHDLTVGEILKTDGVLRTETLSTESTCLLLRGFTPLTTFQNAHATWQ